MQEAKALDENGVTRPFRIEDAPWVNWAEGVRFGGAARDLGRYGGGSKIGVVMEILPPGKQSCPFHFHMVEEEHILFLEGEATLRLGNKQYAVKAGDYVCFPAGQKAGHCLVNTSGAPCRYLIIGDNDPNEVCVYPDSDKIGVVALGQRIRGREVEYWDGEKRDEPL
ncbi:MAG: cupin domain-containing protein [Hyphomonadaceae bacterium]